MRILIALTYYRPHYSGLTIHAEREARALVKRGHAVTVLTSRFDKSLPVHEVKDGVEIIRPGILFHISKGVVMPTMPYWAWKLIRQADVVHLHAPQLDAAFIAMTSKLLGKPVVLTYHCDLQLPRGFIHRLANIASNLANTVSARLADVIVHNTRDYAEHSPFLQHYLDKLYPIYPPVDLSAVTTEDRLQFRQKFSLDPEQPLLGMAARLATEKGVEYLAEALPRVLERYPNARVLFVGPYQNVVGEEAYAARLEPLLAAIQDSWSFLGILSPVEMAAFFHECDLTVLPSINSTESYGLVQIESMSCGTPVVTSDLPGVRVPVQSTGMGLVVPARDADALAEAILAVLSNPEAYRAVSTDIIDQSTPAAVAAAYEKAFLMAQARVRGGKNDYDMDGEPHVGQVSIPANIRGGYRNPPYDFSDNPYNPGDPLRLTDTAIVLAGGMGTRLRSVLDGTPKVLAPVAGKPFLYYLLSYLEGQRIRTVILALGYLAEQVIATVDEMHDEPSIRNLEIRTSLEPEPLGTGGALKAALAAAPLEAGKPFFVLNGDTLFQADLRELEKSLLEHKSTATIALLQSEESEVRGSVRMDESGLIRSFIEKPAQGGRALVNGGIYLLQAEAVSMIPPGKQASLEQEVFPALADAGQLAGCVQQAYFIDIGTPESLQAFEEDVLEDRVR